VSSGQHGDLLQAFIEHFRLRIDHDLCSMQRGQSLNALCATILSRVDAVLVEEKPDVVLVQGDTTTSVAGALAAFHRHVKVAHVEAGLRSGDRSSPFPEEMNRRLISRLADLHFAPTSANRESLLSEGIEPRGIFVTGNTVIDALQDIVAAPIEDPRITRMLAETQGLRRIVLTTHRRESFGERITAHLRILRGFVDRHPDVALVFPVHPNPVVVDASQKLLAGCDRVHLIQALPYHSFIKLLAAAWLVVSDSGGVQEEAPSLGKPLLVLRDTTDRQESIEAGVARLVGESPERLEAMLEEAYQPGSWAEGVREVENPFGRGDSAEQIIQILGGVLRDAEIPADAAGVRGAP
jgi:UDP-N-acetylglucosamine 2-epimerase (non-hydrolysing)